MNERILEFARQTGLCDADGDFFGGKISQYEEFAELIVGECADIAKHHVMNISTYSDADFVEKQIQEHFGVKR